MRKRECFLFVLKSSHICYYIICMTVRLIGKWNCVGLFRTLQNISVDAFGDFLPNISDAEDAIRGFL